MNRDRFNLKSSKPKKKIYIDEADAIKLLRALEAECDENVEAGLAPRKGGFLDLLKWLFQPGESAEAH